MLTMYLVFKVASEAASWNVFGFYAHCPCLITTHARGRLSNAISRKRERERERERERRKSLYAPHVVHPSVLRPFAFVSYGHAAFMDVD